MLSQVPFPHAPSRPRSAVPLTPLANPLALLAPCRTPGGFDDVSPGWLPFLVARCLPELTGEGEAASGNSPTWLLTRSPRGHANDHLRLGPGPSGAADIVTGKRAAEGAVFTSVIPQAGSRGPVRPGRARPFTGSAIADSRPRSISSSSCTTVRLDRLASRATRYRPRDGVQGSGRRCRRAGRSRSIAAHESRHHSAPLCTR